MISGRPIKEGVGDWVLLGAPVYTLAGYRGMGEAPDSLRKAGLSEIGGAADLGNVSLPPLKKDVTDGRTKNLGHFREATAKIYAASRSLDAERVIVVGGECSETVGATAGLGEAFGGRPGMLWLDAHGDFNTPETSPSGYVGGMCLALACGRARGLRLGVEDEKLPLTEERLVHVGSRALDPPEVAALTSSPAKLFTSQQVKKSGAADVAEEAARHLDNRSDWIICHLDVDVIDPKFVSAVDYPTPGGLTLEETALIIRELNGTKKLRVLELAAYNPSKDRAARSAATINELMRKSLAP